MRTPLPKPYSVPVHSGRAIILGVALLGPLILAGCAGAPAARSEFSSAQGMDLPSRLNPAQAGDVTIYAIGLVGTPYRFGGNTPQSGFDCSGLIGHVYMSRAQVATPRTVARLSSWGNPIATESVRSGDLVLFSQRDVVTHAGIYVGEGRFVHAPSTGGEVRLDSLTSRYWATQQVAFRRP